MDDSKKRTQGPDKGVLYDDAYEISSRIFFGVEGV